MARENVKKLEELLRSDKNLQAKVNDLAVAFEGDMTDDKSLFEATIGAAAAEVGLPVAYDEAVGTLLESELSDDELDAVAGGAVCYFIGGSRDVESECSNSKGSACAYAGVTMGDSW